MSKEIIDELLERVERLEKAVFEREVKEVKNQDSTLEESFNDFVSDINDKLSSLKNQFEKDDSIIFQAVLNNNGGVNHQLTALSVLDNEEKDEDIELLCNVLSSKQRISILRHLAKNEYSSGELVELTKMAGGHLHHHLKELLVNKFICKKDNGKYIATDQGINVYLTIAALNRRLRYNKSRS